MNKKLCGKCKINPRRFGTKCRECHNEYTKQYWKLHPEKRQKSSDNYRKDLRLVVLSHYSNGFMGCACCGEEEDEFLCLDHIDNNGSIERKSMGIGVQFYKKLIENGFESNLQILCYNCNACKHRVNGCPHKRRQKNSTIV